MQQATSHYKTNVCSCHTLCLEKHKSVNNNLKYLNFRVYNIYSDRSDLCRPRPVRENTFTTLTLLGDIDALLS